MKYSYALPVLALFAAPVLGQLQVSAGSTNGDGTVTPPSVSYGGGSSNGADGANGANGADGGSVSTSGASNSGGSVTYGSSGTSSSGSTSVGGNTCYGDIYNNVCCVGKFGGSGAQSQASELDGLGTSIQADVASRLAEAGISADVNKRAAQLTATSPLITERAILQRAAEATPVADGWTCFGSAISFDDPSYSQKLAAATSARAASPADFTAPADGGAASSVEEKANSAKSASSTGKETLSTSVVSSSGSAGSAGSSGADGASGSAGSTGAPVSSTSQGASAAGQSTSSSRAGAVAFATQAPMLMGVAAGMFFYGAM